MEEQVARVHSLLRTGEVPTTLPSTVLVAAVGMWSLWTLNQTKQTNISDLLLQSPELCAQGGEELGSREVSCTFFCLRLFSTVVSLDTVLTIPALCALLTGVILNGLTLRKYGFDVRACMFYAMFV